MNKIVTIVGARPQFIKAAVVSRKIRDDQFFEEILVHTGQHYDANMSKVFFETMDIPEPDYNLGIIEKTHGAQTGRMLEGIEKILLEENPDYVLVYGDTNSTLAGALAASKLHIPLAHVEAGLRSFNKIMPEEINRVLTDHVSDYLFTPTRIADENLTREGIQNQKIIRVGDVMLEASLYYSDNLQNSSKFLDEIGVKSKEYLLATIHRAENTDDSKRLKVIFSALGNISTKVNVVMPLHPRTKNILERKGLYDDVKKKINVIEPIGYLDMIMLEKHAKIIVTDSGGVQKEAYFHRVPCVTLRTETEWVELVECGWNTLVDPDDKEWVVRIISNVLNNKNLPEYKDDLYGRGDSSSIILNVMRNGANI